MADTPHNAITVGACKGPHGLQGWVKVRLDMAEPSLLLHTPVSIAGQTYAVQGLKTVGQGLWAVQLQGITTPEAAAALKGHPVVADRSTWPTSEDEVYLADMLGQTLYNSQNQPVGTVASVAELPAGPALVIHIEGRKTQPIIPLEEAFVALESNPPHATLTLLGDALLNL